MAGSPKFFGRQYTLTLTSPEGNTQTFRVEPGEPAMDIKFDVTYARGQTAREGTISILGLSLATMQTYLNCAAMTRGKAMSQLLRVKLEAGYFTSAGTVEVINGFAWYATISAPPQMWLQLSVNEYNPMGGKTVEQINSTGEAIPIRQAIESVVSQFDEVEGVSFSVQDKTQDELLSQDIKVMLPVFPTKITLPETVRILSDSLSDKIRLILNTRNNDEGCRIIEVLDKGEGKVVPASPAMIDGNNGLLSVTGINAVNGCITTFLDGTVADELTHMILSSALNPQADGKYCILKKQYIGHYMGQEWYTRYFCSAREATE